MLNGKRRDEGSAEKLLLVARHCMISLKSLELRSGGRQVIKWQSLAVTGSCSHLLC